MSAGIYEYAVEGNVLLIRCLKWEYPCLFMRGEGTVKLLMQRMMFSASSKDLYYSQNI